MSDSTDTEDNATYERRIVKEQCEYLDQLALLNFEHAIALAKRNVDSLGGWGRVWLETHADRISKLANAPEVDFAKAVDIVMKGIDSTYKRAHSIFKSALDAYQEKNPGLNINDFCKTSEGAELSAACSEAHTQRLNGPVEFYTKRHDSEIRELDAAIAKATEEFSLRFNLDPSVARKRLETISPSFVALVKRHADAHHARMESVKKARDAAQSWYVAEANAAVHAEQERLEKERLAKMKPSERAFEKRVSEIMSMRKCDRHHAVAWGIANDAALQAIHAIQLDGGGQ